MPKRQRGRPILGQFDLFGEVAVTWPECWWWTANNAPAVSPQRALEYIAAYNVAFKVARARASLRGRERWPENHAVEPIQAFMRPVYVAPHVGKRSAHNAPRYAGIRGNR